MHRKLSPLLWLIFAVVGVLIVYFAKAPLQQSEYPLLAWMHKHWIVPAIVVAFIIVGAFAIKTVKPHQPADKTNAPTPPTNPPGDTDKPD